GTKMVDYVLDIAKEKGLEDVYAIVLPDNTRALSLLKKMGFNFEYLGDGTVRCTLNLKNEDSDNRCQDQPKKTENPETETPTNASEQPDHKKQKEISAA